MKKNILAELNRNREIMGLPTLTDSRHITSTPAQSISEVNKILDMMDLPLLTEQESDAVLGYEDHKECKCNDGSSAPQCCTDYAEWGSNANTDYDGYGPDYFEYALKNYDIKLYPHPGSSFYIPDPDGDWENDPLSLSFDDHGIKPHKEMYLQEMLEKLKATLAMYKKGEKRWKTYTDEEENKLGKAWCKARALAGDFKGDRMGRESCDLSYAWMAMWLQASYLPDYIKKFEAMLEMSDEEFAALDAEDRGMYARTSNERAQAAIDYNVGKQERDKGWQERQRKERESLSAKMAEDNPKRKKALTKLMAIFYKKLDRVSEKRWDNKDKEYNAQDPPWEMTEDDKIQLFTIFKDYLIAWKNQNPKLWKEAKKKYGKIAKKYFSKIHLKNVKGPEETIELEGGDEPGEESCPAPVVRLPFQIFGIEEDDWKPFANNSSALSPDLIGDVDKLITTAREFKEKNPEFTYKVVKYKIWTSASRARNGGAVKEWSFKQLSESRAKSVETYVNGKLSDIGVATITPTIDAGGTNKDGSSGPNPPYPFNMVNGSGPDVVADRRDGMSSGKENEGKERTKYGKVDTSCKNDHGGKFVCPTYDKFKYVGLELTIEGASPEVTPEEPEDTKGREEPPVIEVIPSRKWEISFIPEKKYTKKYKKVMTWPKIRWGDMIHVYWQAPDNRRTECADFMFKRMEINFFIPSGIKVGPVIQDAINNGMASYGDFTFTTKE